MGEPGPDRRTLIVALLAAAIVASTATAGAQSDGAAALARDGFALLDKSQPDAATARFDACLAVARAETNLLAEAECTRGLGRAAQARREFDAAGRFFASAHALYERAGDRPGLGRNYTDRAFLAYMQARWIDVRELYGRAAAEYEAAGLKTDQAMALRGQTFAQGVPIDERLQILERAWLAAQEGKSSRVEALVLHHWGDMLFVQGEYDQALAKTQRAVSLLEDADDPASLGRALTSLGRLYRVMGLPRDAIVVYRRVLTLQEKASDVLGQTQTYGAIANALTEQGLARDALGYYERALAQSKPTGNRPQISFNLGRYAFGLLQVGDYAEAIAFAQQAIDGDTGSDDLSAHYAVKADALRALKRYAEAEQASNASLAGARRLGSTEWELDALVNRAALFDAMGRGAEALRDLEAATAVLEAQRARLPPSDFLKSGFSEKHQDVMSRTIASLHGAGRVEDALTVAEQARARAFLDLLASRESAAPAVAATPTAQTVRAAAARLASTVVTYWVGADAILVWVVPAQGEIVSRRVPIARTRLQQLVRSTWSLSAPALVARGDEGGRVEVTAAERGLAFVTMRGGAPLAPTGLETGAYRELFDLLIAPVLGSLPRAPGSLLTIVPHGPLFELSFAALVNPRGRYLLEDFRLHYAPSAATLEFTSRRTTSAVPAARYLFVANPATAPSGSPALAPLPGAEREVKAVARLFAPRRTTTLIGRAATEDAVRRDIGDYRIVHFATHGLVSRENPFDSFLALAPGSDRRADGRLTAAEIHELRLSADLVVLSACRAAGGRISGDGIVGLTRAFFTAGTPSIVAALWDMADESAEHLLPRFYTEWQRSGDKGAALRAAQLSLLRDLRARKLTVNTPFGAMPLPPHPALWANLVLIGEPR